MSTQQTPAVRVGEGSRITGPVAVVGWIVAWLGGTIASLVVLGGIGPGGIDVVLVPPTGDTVDPTTTVPARTVAGDPAIWAIVASATVMWIVMLAVLREISRRHGARSFAADYGLRFAPVDLVGVPLGVLSQLVLLRLVYWPLQSLWPDTFAPAELEDRAQDLYDSARGVFVVLLVLMVVVGAPLVEELLYRGLLQGGLARRLQEWVAVVLVAAWFALVHFAPVEFPGLFAFGLVLGACTVVTGRIGLAVVTHVAFNATGLLWVATR